METASSSDAVKSEISDQTVNFGKKKCAPYLLPSLPESVPTLALLATPDFSLSAFPLFASLGLVNPTVTSDPSTAPDPREPPPFNPWNPDDDPGTRSRFAKLETPFRVRQVETHLVFGFCARHLPIIAIAAIVLAVAYFGLLVWAAINGEHLGPRFGMFGFAAAGVATICRASYRQQAIMAWLATKLILAISCLNLIPIALCLWLAQNRIVWRSVFFLSLVWLPGPEFNSRFVSGQRYLTLARLAFSVPLVLAIIHLQSR